MISSKVGRNSFAKDQMHFARLRSIIVDVCLALSATIYAWDHFVRPDGDIGYFSDLKGHDAGVLLREVEEKVASMRKLKVKLEALDVWCKDCIAPASCLLFYPNRGLTGAVYAPTRT